MLTPSNPIPKPLNLLLLTVEPNHNAPCRLPTHTDVKEHLLGNLRSISSSKHSPEGTQHIGAAEYEVDEAWYQQYVLIVQSAWHC
jgi:hypothetical protein